MCNHVHLAGERFVEILIACRVRKRRPVRRGCIPFLGQLLPEAHYIIARLCRSQPVYRRPKAVIEVLLREHREIVAILGETDRAGVKLVVARRLPVDIAGATEHLAQLACIERRAEEHAMVLYRKLPKAPARLFPEADRRYGRRRSLPQRPQCRGDHG